MAVPYKVTLKGDREYACNFVGAARSQMRILENQLSFQDLKQGIRRVKLNPRTMVTSVVCFNQKEVIIDCLPIGKKGKKERVPDCFCCCCWAMGFIVGYTYECDDNDNEECIEHVCNDKECEDNDEECEEGCSDTKTRYDVRICQGDRYSLFQGCISTDFAHYRIGEQVFVLAAYSKTDGPGYTYKDDLADLLLLRDMVPPMFFSFDEYKTSTGKNDFEKCEECERKQECLDETLINCKTTKSDETEESDAACMTETITISSDEIVRESRDCEEYQFETGSACGVNNKGISGDIPSFYIVPIGCEGELGKWL